MSHIKRCESAFSNHTRCYHCKSKLIYDECGGKAADKHARTWHYYAYCRNCGKLFYDDDEFKRIE